MRREDQEQAVVRALAARLKRAAPALFGPATPEAHPRSAPTPASEPAREAPPTLGSIMAERDHALRAEAARAEADRAERAEEERRANDPILLAEQRLAALAHRLSVDEVIAVNETLQAARDEIAAGHERLGLGYLSEAKQWMSDGETYFAALDSE